MLTRKLYQQGGRKGPKYIPSWDLPAKKEELKGQGVYKRADCRLAARKGTVMGRTKKIGHKPRAR